MDGHVLIDNIENGLRGGKFNKNGTFAIVSWKTTEREVWCEGCVS